MARRFTLQRDAERQPAATFELDYAAALNEAQFAAATAGDGPVLVVAGAGTGKTRTLVYRVAYLIETGVPPEQILLLTFTRRAAREMLGRGAALLDGRCERVRGGTFHAICLHVLRRYAERIRYPRNFTILDASDAADVIDLLRTEAGLHRSSKRFPKKNTLQAAFSAAASRAAPLAEIVASEYPQFVEHLDAMGELASRFETYKRRHGMMDYDDLLARTVELCEADPAAHRLVASANRHILVDEFQDTNRVQARLVALFAAVHGNVTAVGDDAQSIYGFRGADLQNILRFPEAFPGTRILKLERNYRSTQPILDLANAVLEQARDRFDKHLYTDRKEGEKPALVPAPDTRWQSRFVSQLVLQLREEGVPLNRTAVLFRSSYNAFDLEAELDRYRIPYVKYGGLKLSEAAHVRDVLAHLRVAENPGDAVAWMRILKLVEGIGARTAQSLIERFLPSSDPLALEPASLSARYAQPLARLVALLKALREAPAGAGAQVALVLDYYRPILERVYADDHARRAQDLEAFLSVAEGHGSRAVLLEALALDPIDLAAHDVEATYQDEAPLVLSTIHSAKGLEFDTVFVIDALEGVLPSQYAVRNREELDEELRLLYVALTRAERLLFVCYPMVQFRRGAGDYLASPSRFIEAVPTDLFEQWVLDESPAGEDQPSLPAGDAPRQLPPADGLPF